MTAPRFVVYGSRRYIVIEDTDLDGAPALVLQPQRGGVRIVARAEECREDRRHVIVRGYAPHRGRIVVLDVVQQAGETMVEIRHLGRRAGFKMTLEGLYDTAARQVQRNLALEKAHKRRTRGKR